MIWAFGTGLDVAKNKRSARKDDRNWHPEEEPKKNVFKTLHKQVQITTTAHFNRV
jgi:hypothetical protein